MGASGSGLDTSGGGSDLGGGGSGGLGSSGAAFAAGPGGAKGRSLGQALSDTAGVPTKPAATTTAGTRAGQAVGENGPSGLVWLLIALGAITAVAGGGVAMRRRQARAGY